MPEGDTIHRAARSLRVALLDKTIVRFASTRILTRDLAGKRFTSIEAHGKHLLLRLDDGRAIQAHMGMTGSMHVYRPGERWRRSEGAARMVIEVEGFVVVAFSVPTLRIVDAGVSGGAHDAGVPRAVARLGPDVLAPDFDAELAVKNLRARAELPLGVAIMDQTALAGVGNIYKSETLFTLGLDPFAPVARFDDAALRAVVARAPPHAEQPEGRHAHDDAQRGPAVLRLRAQGAPLPPLPHDDRDAAPGRAGALDLLLPEVPALVVMPRAAPRRGRGHRRTRRHVRRRRSSAARGPRRWRTTRRRSRPR